MPSSDDYLASSFFRNFFNLHEIFYKWRSSSDYSEILRHIYIYTNFVTGTISLKF